MINPATICDAYVSALQNIPAYVAEMGGNAANIFAYHDKFPVSGSLAKRIQTLDNPSTMILWSQTVPGDSGDGSVWEHFFSFILLAKEQAATDAVSGYYTLFGLIVNGIPTNGPGLTLMQYEVNPTVSPMSIPTCARRSNAEGLDYFEISTSVKEYGL